MKRSCVVVLVLVSPAALSMEPSRVDLSVGTHMGRSARESVPISLVESRLVGGDIIFVDVDGHTSLYGAGQWSTGLVLGGG